MGASVGGRVRVGVGRTGEGPAVRSPPAVSSNSDLPWCRTTLCEAGRPGAGRGARSGATAGRRQSAKRGGPGDGTQRRRAGSEGQRTAGWTGRFSTTRSPTCAELSSCCTGRGAGRGPPSNRGGRRGLAEDRRAFCRRLVTPSEAKLPVDETKTSTKMSVADAKCPCGGEPPRPTRGPLALDAHSRVLETRPQS